MSIAIAAMLYFLIVFGAGFVLGPIRVFWLEPWLGPAAAAACEAPLLLAAMVFAARWVAQKIKPSTKLAAMLAMGLGALGFVLLADFTVGSVLRGLNWNDQIGYFSTTAGRLYLTLLAAFALMPALVNTRHVTA